MDAFGHLSVFFSIILGLAITQILQAFASVLHARGRIVPYAPAFAWAVLLLVIGAQSWWALFGLRHVVTWQFSGYAVVLAQLVATYLLSTLVLPDVESDDDRPVDLRAHYYAQSRWFFTLMCVLLFTSMAKERVVEGHWPFGANLWFHLFFIGSCAIGAVTKRPAVHQVLAPTAFAAILAYIVALFTRLS